MPKKSRAMGWGEWIRDHLSNTAINQEDYVFSMHKQYNAYLKGLGYKGCSFNTFAGYVWVLVRLKALVRTRDAPAQLQPGAAAMNPRMTNVNVPLVMHKQWTRHYYTIQQGAASAAYWVNPREYFDNSYVVGDED
jgi:hypothetical protein